MVLQGRGYIDDSGSHKGGLFVLAGYVLPTHRWAHFSGEWLECLNKHPRITYFKSHEAATGEKEFLGMTVDSCNAKLMELADIIRRNSPICLATSLAWSDYQVVFERKLPKQIDNPYFILFYRILELMLICQQEIYEIEPYEKVDFTFDQQGKLGRTALRFYSQVRDSCTPEMRKMLGTCPDMGDDKKIAALQASDMVAWQIHRKFQFPKEPRPALNLITSRGCERLDQEFLTETLRKLPSSCR